jgi:hypothetical protein
MIEILKIIGLSIGLLVLIILGLVGITLFMLAISSPLILIVWILVTKL